MSNAAKMICAALNVATSSAQLFWIFFTALAQQSWPPLGLLPSNFRVREILFALSSRLTLDRFHSFQTQRMV